MKALLNKIREHHNRFGTYKTLLTGCDQILNYFILIDCLHIIVLDKCNVKPVPLSTEGVVSVRYANETDLLSLKKAGEWQIDNTKIQQLREGDLCLLTLLDNEIAGYTWIHITGRPTLMPGLKLHVPRCYVYNYGGFTHPKYRGKNLQAFRHQQVLKCAECSDKVGLIGYVKYTNWSSIRGQEKAGYRKIGRLLMVGRKQKYMVVMSKELRRIGLKRIT